MRIAVIVPGQPRFSKPFDKFIESLSNIDNVDWFFWLWKNNENMPGRIDMAPNWLTVDPTWAEKKIKDSLPPTHNLVRFEIGDQDDFVFPTLTGSVGWIHAPIWSWRQFQGLYNADQLRQQHEKKTGPYDMVIRSRADLSFIENTPNYREILQSLKENPSQVITSGGGVHGHHYKINDIFLIGSSASMTVYSNLVNHIDEYNKKGIIFHNETLSAYHLFSNGIENVIGNFTAGLREGNYSSDGISYSDFGHWG